MDGSVVPVVPQKVGSVVDVRKVQALLAEYVGTFFLVLTICLSAQPPGTPEPSHQFLAIGAALAALIYAFDHISGAHFNPAVTLGAVINRRMGLGTGMLYIIVQTLGGMTGAVLSYCITSTSMIRPTPASNLGAAFSVEALYTFALVLVMQNAGMEKNTREPNSYFGLAVSFTVLAGAAAVGPISGGCFNPAVGMGIDFASLLTSEGDMSHVWVYWVGPATGAVVASFTKMYMNLPSHQEAEGLPMVVPITEAIGTYFLVLTAALTGEGLAIGGILLGMVYMGDHVCGADYNPAVTAGVAIRMAVPWREYWKVVLTTLAQYLGAFLAALTAQAVNGSIRFPAPSGIHGEAGAVLFEGLWTGILVYVVCAVMTPTHGEDDPVVVEERKGHSRSYQGLAIGFVVVGGIYCAGKYGAASGGVFNPALGVALVSVDAIFNGGSLSALWVYIVGPMCGSVLGAGLFTLLHYHRDPMLLDYEVIDPTFY